ncbi:MAG: Lrp/AsnC family transcriptional regulator, partial [Parvibaculaceae bacterium]
KLAAVRSIARELAKSPEVYFVSITTGTYDILIGAVFRSNDELLKFMTDRLPRIPGIERTRTATVLDVVKRFLTFDVPPKSGKTRKKKSNSSDEPDGR